MAEEFISLAQAMEESPEVESPEQIFSLNEAMADPEKTDFNEVRELGYWSSIRQSFLNGNRSSSLDTLSYEALIGTKDYEKDVKPEKDAFYSRMQEYRLDDEGWLKKAGLSVAGMIPAMAKGTAQGWSAALATGLTWMGGAAVLGQAGPQAATPEEVVTMPAAFVTGFGKGKLVGSMQYWYRQGAGSLYGDLKDEGIEDQIAKPISHVAGALYGAIEFSQVDKLIPGSKAGTKKLITSSIKKTMGNMAKRYGANWLSEVSEEGIQEFVLQASKDVASEIAGITNQTTGTIIEKAMVAGWGAVKESAIPMMMMMGPTTAVDVKRGLEGSKALAKQEAEKTEFEESVSDIMIEPVTEEETVRAEELKTKLVETLEVENKARESKGIEITAEEKKSAEEVTLQKEELDWDVEEEVTPEAIKPKKKGTSLLQEKIQNIKDKMDQNGALKDSLAWLKTLQKNYRRRIAPHKDGTLKEEYDEIPKIYKNKKGITSDQIADEIGISENELAGYLQNLDSQVDQLQKSIEANKPNILNIKISELTDLKKRFQDMLTGKKEGAIEIKKEIKAFQKELTALIKGLEIEAKDKAKFLSSIKEVTTRQQLDKQINDVLRRAEQYAEATEKRSLKDNISKELKGTKNIKQGSKAVGKYNYGENKFFEYLRGINSLNQKDAQSELDAMPEDAETEMDLIKKRSLSFKANGMSGSVALARQVLSDIKQLKYLGKLSKDEADFLKKVERSIIIEDTSDAIDGIDANKDTIKTKIGNMYRKGMSNLDSFINSIAGKNVANKLFAENLEQDKLTSTSKETESLSRKIANILGLKSSDHVIGEIQNRSAEVYDIVDVQGLETKISLMDIMDIYNSLKNEHLKERYYNAFGQEQIDALIEENLSPNEKLMADAMMESVQKYKEILNIRNIEITGLDLGFIDQYWPATSEHSPDILDDYKSQGETPSAMKARSKSTKIFPVPKNAWYKTMKHISESEHVDKMSRKFIELKRTFSNRKIKNQIENKFGKDVYKALMQQIEGISLNAETARNDYISSVFGKWVNNWVLAKIAAPNMNVFVKQLTSSINFAENMPVGAWAKGFTKGLLTPKETFKFMWDNSDGFLQARFNKGFSEAMTNAIDGAEKIGQGKYTLAKVLSSWVRAGDISAIVYGGYSYVAYLESTGMSRSDAFEAFKKATLKSQQSGLTSSRSAWQNNSNSVTKLFLAFKNTANQYFRKQVDAIIQYQNGDITKQQLAKVTTIYSIINPIMYASVGTLMTAGIKGIGSALFGAYHDDDEELLQKLGTDALLQIAVNPFMAIPILDDMAAFAARKAMGKRTWNVMSTPMLDDISTGMQKMTKYDPSFIDYMETFGVAAEIGTGIPIKTPSRLLGYIIGE